MDLKQWLEDTGLSQRQFAEMADAPPNRVNEWMLGKLSVRIAARVEAITQGKVTALSFFPEESVFAKAGVTTAKPKISNPKKKVTR
jgi:hypothetical protein